MVLIGVLVTLVAIVGFVIFKLISYTTPQATTDETSEQAQQVEIPVVDTSVSINVKDSPKANTIVLTVDKLDSKYKQIAYELSYESEGLIKGVNSGSKPIDVAGKDSFEREIYLGTCSRNVCKPDAGVTAVTIAFQFTDTKDAKSQFSKEYEL